MSPVNPPRTSVIIPARNAARTLAEALDSLLAQSDPDWEALIINDGSTDATADVIEDYVSQAFMGKALGPLAPVISVLPVLQASVCSFWTVTIGSTIVSSPS